MDSAVAEIGAWRVSNHQVLSLIKQGENIPREVVLASVIRRKQVATPSIMLKLTKSSAHSATVFAGNKYSHNSEPDKSVQPRPALLLVERLL